MLSPPDGNALELTKRNRRHLISFSKNHKMFTTLYSHRHLLYTVICTDLASKSVP